MTTIYDIHSYKGGTGVTTTACATALALAKQGKNTLLVNAQETEDTLAWLGLGISSAEGVVHVRDNLSLVNASHYWAYAPNYDAVVVDNGRTTTSPKGSEVVRVCVVRNDYMTLRNTVCQRGQTLGLVPEEDVFVLFYDSNITLSDRDVRAVIGHDLIVVNMDTAVQRSIDAGLATMRDHFGWAEEITQMVGVS